MMAKANMTCIRTDLCAWGAKDPDSGKLYGKAMRFACTFSMVPLARTCSGDHEHEVVKGVVLRGAFKGTMRSALSGQYPCHCEPHGQCLQNTTSDAVLSVSGSRCAPLAGLDDVR